MRNDLTFSNEKVVRALDRRRGFDHRNDTAWNGTSHCRRVGNRFRLQRPLIRIEYRRVIFAQQNVRNAVAPRGFQRCRRGAAKPRRIVRVHFSCACARAHVSVYVSACACVSARVYELLLPVSTQTSRRSKIAIAHILLSGRTPTRQ